MPELEPSVPRRGCPFFRPPGPADDPIVAPCIGDGVCGHCERLPFATIAVAEVRYRVDRFLASGYYADVFRATDLTTGEAVALKIFVDEPPKREAWRREVESLASLAHRRIPRLRGPLEADGWLVIAMDLVPGTGLRELVEARGPLDVGSALRVCADVAEAFAYIASLGWTYRDLHPRNIHIGTPLGAMLVDFDGARPPGFPAFPSGRIGYRAPELEREAAVTPACDVYSLAGCLYFALTGDDPPFEAGPLGLRDRLAARPLLSEALDLCRFEDPSQRPTVGKLAALLY